LLEVALSLTKDQRMEKLLIRLDKPFILEFLKRVGQALDKELAYVSSKDLAKV